MNLDKAVYQCFACEARGRVDVDGVAPRSDDDERSEYERRQQRARTRWRQYPIADDRHGARYFAARGLEFGTWRKAVREGTARHITGTWWPVVVAPFVDVHGRFVGVHETYLDHDAPRKAAIEPPRLCWGGPLAGACIRLGPVAERVCIGEGIETVLSAVALDPNVGSPWAAGSAPLLGKIELPEEVREAVICVDRDPAGERETRRLCKRLRRAGVKVVRLFGSDRPGEDLNDLLMRTRADANDVLRGAE